MNTTCRYCNALLDASATCPRCGEAVPKTEPNSTANPPAAAPGPSPKVEPPMSLRRPIYLIGVLVAVSVYGTGTNFFWFHTPWGQVALIAISLAAGGMICLMELLDS